VEVSVSEQFGYRDPSVLTEISKTSLTIAFVFVQIPDIEETPKFCPRTLQPCAGKCPSGNGHLDSKKAVGKQATSDGDWYMPENLDHLLAVINQLPQGVKYRLVAGNTGTGINYNLTNLEKKIFRLEVLPLVF